MKKNVVVLDTSIAVKWVLKEQDSNIAVTLLTEWVDKKVIMAPTLLAYEATNTLHRHVRSGGITLDDAQRGLKEVIFTALVFDFSHGPDLNIRAMELARQFNLPATYDAHYLALAEREECELWTADKRLWNTIGGKLPWVRWLGDYSAPENADLKENDSSL